MNKKKVTILYFDNGDFKKIAEREVVYQTIIKQLEDEGRHLENYSKDMSIFSDGSVIALYKLGFFTRIMRSTHIYVDKSIFHLADCDMLLSKVLKPMLYTDEYNDRYELNGDRLLVYEVLNGEIKVEKHVG